MRAGLAVTPAAAQNLDTIRAWFRQSGAGPASQRRLARLLGALDSLVDYPNRGRRIGTGPIRIATSERQRIVTAATHAAAGNTVVILRILGPGQSN